MNWKLKALLLFDRLNPSLRHDDSADINELRRHAVRIAALGTKLFHQVLPVKSIQNTKADAISIRIYDNSGQPGQPVIIYYHGGGFAMYDLDTHDAVCRRHCVMNQSIVVSVDYRLAPEYTFPAAHEDAWQALQWIHKNISKYNGNPDKIILAGDSAGGNLAACMAIRAKKENLFQLAGQVLVYPWVDGRINSASVDRNANGYFLTKETMLWFQKKYTPDPKDHCNPLVSPLFETDFTGLAPAFIPTAEYDPLLDDGKSYADKLSAAGVQVNYKEYKGLVHGFLNIPGIDPEAMQAFRDIRDFIGQLD
jgi:acetyl esterase